MEEQNKLKIKFGDIVEFDGKQHRFLSISKNIAVMVVIGSSKVEFITINLDNLLKMIDTDIAVVTPKEEDSTFIKLEDMSDSFRKNYELKKKAMVEFQNHFSPSYIGIKSKKGSAFISKLCEEIGMTNVMFWRTLNGYLQSGFNDNSLVDKRLFGQTRENTVYTKRTGRPSNLKESLQSKVVLSEKELKYFEEFRKIYLDRREVTKKTAYQMMLNKYYSETYVTENGVGTAYKPISEVPSFRQFEYYIDKNTSKSDKKIKNTSEREYRNNDRLLLADDIKGNNVTGIGSLWEIDECEMDIFLVGVDTPDKVVTRPVLYAIIDVYSRMIVGYSLAFDNNSVKGLTNCLLSLVDDREELLKKYNISPKDIYWPNMVLPRRIRSDNGAEYISYEAERIFKELGIQHELAPPATGSLKGLVEHIFAKLHIDINVVSEKHGLITKRYDSTHKKDATLNIHDFEKIVLASIVEQNKYRLKYYPRTRKMIDNDVQPIPEELWAYATTSPNLDSTHPIINIERYRYTLLMPINVSIKRNGITFKGLNYLDVNNEWLIKMMKKAGKKTITYEAKIDPRRMGTIYLINDENKIISIDLNPNITGNEDYKELSYEEYMKYYKKIKQDNSEGEIYNDRLKAKVLKHNQQVVNNAEGNKYYVDDSNLRENLQKEKQMSALEHRIMPEIETSSTQPLLENKQVVEESPIEDEEDLENMTEEEIMEVFRNAS